MKVFVTKRKVRFSDTDFAGIIFYPRFFEMLNGVVEDWFEEAVGASFGGIIRRYGVSTPLGDIQTRFVSPCRLDDELEFHLSVDRVSDRSVTLLVETYSEESLKIRTLSTHVCVRRDVTSAVVWPNGFREKISHYCSEETAR